MSVSSDNHAVIENLNRCSTTIVSHGCARIVQRFALVLMFCMPAAVAQASPSESELQAAVILGTDVGIWFEALPNRPRSVGIFSVRISAPLDPEYSTIIEAEVVKNMRQAAPQTQILSCLECRTPQVKVVGDRLTITKGSPNLESMQELAKKTGAETFLALDVFRTRLSVQVQATIYQASSAEIITTEQFKIPALNLNDASMQISLMAGPGLPFGGRELGSGESAEALGANFMILEELGFGKGGLNIGAVFAGGQGQMFYAVPTLGWRGRFGSSAVHTLFDVGLGYGFANDSAKGIAASLGYAVFLGSITSIGLRSALLLPLSAPNTAQPLLGGVTLQIGLSLGR